MGFLLLAVVTIPSAQTPGGQPQAAGIPELLAEVRALRAELNHAAGASMRMQLLVARLTLQEGRLTGLSRQIDEAQRQLATAVADRAEAQKRVGDLEGALGSGALPPELRKEGEHQLRAFMDALPQKSAHEAQLRAQESDLSALFAAEQARWVEFNARLDAIERSLPPDAK